MRRIKRTVGVVMVVRDAGSRRSARRAAELRVGVDEELERSGKRLEIVSILRREDDPLEASRQRTLKLGSVFASGSFQGNRLRSKPKNARQRRRESVRS